MGCGLWEWYDPPMCNVAANLVPLLRDEIMKLNCHLNEVDGLSEERSNNLHSCIRENHQLKYEINSCEEENNMLKKKVITCQNEAEASLEEIDRLRDAFVLQKRTLKLYKCATLMLVMFMLFLLYLSG